MKSPIAAIILLSAAASSLARASSDCVNADPSATVAGLSGDSEFAVDPQDPAQNAIYINNVGSGASSVVVARVDGPNGEIVPGSLYTVADNFNGSSVIQGPEFVQPPGGELGIIYPGSGGIYGVFRPPQPKSWHDFSLNLDGTPTNGTPSLLPTSVGQYPLSQNPLGHRTYGQDLGRCNVGNHPTTDSCYSALDFGAATNVDAVLAPQGFTVYDTTQNRNRDGYIFLSACQASVPPVCGLYEGLIDNVGGFAPNTVTLLAQAQEAPQNIAAAQHPVTGTTVLFSQNGTTAIDVWEQPAGGGALTLIASVPSIVNSHHYDTRTSTTEVVLHYYGPQRGAGGSYTIPVTASGSALAAGAAKKISVYNNGSDLMFLPAANRWAFYVYSPFERCWVTP